MKALFNQMKTEQMEVNVCKDKQEAFSFKEYILNERSQAQNTIMWNAHSIEQAYEDYQLWLEFQYYMFKRNEE